MTCPGAPANGTVSVQEGQLERGRDSFNRYYSELFLDRWPSLSKSLAEPGLHEELAEGLNRPYYLDPASIAVAELLPIRGANEVVDLCAAPGGKSLVLVLRSFGLLQPRVEQAANRVIEDAAVSQRPVRIVLNEKSNRRRRRLISVVDEHLPSFIREGVRIYGHDAAKWGIHRPETAESVLADVPCSSEAHVLSDEGELANWNAARIKRNAAVQHSIIASAIDTVRPGGYVLYVTCALTPVENDDVVAWALTRRGGRIQPIADAGIAGEKNAGGEPISKRSVEILNRAERTEFGLHILPDRTNGAGPLYCALLKKAAAPTSGDSFVDE
jgi:16S rRNA C967 or C1407 C5-methylase (RsmB/RsmF family)